MQTKKRKSLGFESKNSSRVTWHHPCFELKRLKNSREAKTRMKKAISVLMVVIAMITFAGFVSAADRANCDSKGMADRQNAAARKCGTYMSVEDQKWAERDFETRKASALFASALPSSVNTYVHIVTCNGSGDVSGLDASQINVLKNAYGIQFPYTVDKTENCNWYNLKDGSKAERDMKKALRQGTCDDLNLYT